MRAWKWAASGILAFAVYMGASFLSGGWLPGWQSLQHAGVLPLSRYEITAPKELRLNQAGTVSVTGYYIDNTPEPADSLTCSADVAPASLHGLSSSDKCDTLLKIFTDSSNFVQSNAPMRVKVTVHAIRTYYRFARWFGPASESTTITLRDEAQPEIVAIGAPQDQSGISVLIGSIIRLRAFPPSTPVGNMRCQWFQEGSASNPFSPTEGCKSVVFSAPKTAVQVGPTTASIGVNVTDSYNHAIGSATATVQFHLPRANFSMIVVDTSVRMKGAKFDAALARITRQVSEVALNGGWFGLTAFGGGPDPEVACRTVDELYTLAPFSTDDAQHAVGKVSLGPSRWAPLDLAIERAAREFNQPALLDRTHYPDNLFYFIVLTGGGDTCESTPFEQVFRVLRGAMSKTELQHIYLDSALLAAVIATSLPRDRAAAIWRDPAYTEENRAVLLVPRGPEQAATMMDDLAIMADLRQSQKTRVRACDNLLRLISAEDEHGRAVVSSHCEVVGRR